MFAREHPVTEFAAYSQNPAEKAAVDPVADDLATLALDILVDEAGYTRAGPNLLLVPGA